MYEFKFELILQCVDIVGYMRIQGTCTWGECDSFGNRGSLWGSKIINPNFIHIRVPRTHAKLCNMAKGN